MYKSCQKISLIIEVLHLIMTKLNKNVHSFRPEEKCSLVSYLTKFSSSVIFPLYYHEAALKLSVLYKASPPPFTLPHSISGLL